MATQRLVRPLRRSSFVGISHLTLLLILTSCATEGVPVSEQCSGLECELQELGEQAGFDIMVPGGLPAYLAFENARFDPDTGSVILSYVHRDGSMERLQISQRPVDDLSPFNLDAFYPGEAIEQVQVGPFVGQNVQGVFTGEAFDPTVSNQQFVWSIDRMEFWIAATLPAESAKATMLQIAQSMDG